MFEGVKVVWLEYAFRNSLRLEAQLTSVTCYSTLYRWTTYAAVREVSGSVHVAM